MSVAAEPKVKLAPLSEADKVRQWRIREAMHITHCSLKQASLFASSDGDLHLLADLVARGCPVELALRIV